MNAHSTVAAEAAAAGKQLAKGTGYNTLTRTCSHLSLYHSEKYFLKLLRLISLKNWLF